jgi:hypothetical protein
MAGFPLTVDVNEEFQKVLAPYYSRKERREFAKKSG